MKRKKNQKPEGSRTFAQDIKLFCRGIGIVRRVSPGYLTLLLVRTFFNRLSPFINLYMSAFILTELLGEGRIDRLIKLVCITLVLDLIVYLIDYGMSRYINGGGRIFLFYQQFGIHNDMKMFALDYASIEDPETHRMFNRYQEMFTKMGAGLPTVVKGVVDTVGNLMTICFSIGIIVELLVLGVFSGGYGTSWINSIPAVIVICVLMVGLCVLRILFTSSSTQKSQKAVMDMLPFKRIFEFYTAEYVGNYHAGKDIRLYDQQELIEQDMMSEYPRMLRAAGKMQNGMAAHRISESVIGGLSDLGIYLLVAVRAAAGAVGIGNILKYAQGIIRLTNAIAGILNTVSYVRARNECLAVLFEYLDLPNKMEQGDGKIQPDERGGYTFEFRNVSFQYPNTERYALENINLTFRSGERMAVVGMNGSGKTTLIKLLCRLYDPTEGEILLNGVNIRTLSYQDYLEVFSVVFQDFGLFALTLVQNVTMCESPDANQRQRAEECLRLAGFGDRLDAFPDGLDTYLYRKYDENGIEISGGEAQKIALARALYKSSPVLILDEPTAALDPVAEFEIYSQFDRIVGDRTAIFISHRLSSCRFCHDIAVFDDGRLVQRGSHEELLSDTDGKYHELWYAQAQYYTEQGTT